MIIMSLRIPRVNESEPFELICMMYESDYRPDPDIEVPKRFSHQAQFLMEAMGAYCTEEGKDFDQVVEQCKKFGHGKCYSQVLTVKDSEEVQWRDYYTTREFHHLLELMPTEGYAYDVFVSQLSKIVNSKDTKFNISKFWTSQPHMGESIFLEEKTRGPVHIEFINDYVRYFEKLFNYNTDISVDTNGEIMFSFTDHFRMYEPGYISDIPSSICCLNQVSGFTIVHEIPFLLGKYLALVVSEMEPDEIKSLFEKLENLDLCRSFILKPGQVLMCSPYHFRCFQTPSEAFNPELRGEISLLRGVYLEIKSLKKKLLSQMDDAEWLNFITILTDIPDEMEGDCSTSEDETEYVSKKLTTRQGENSVPKSNISNYQKSNPIDSA